MVTPLIVNAPLPLPPSEIVVFSPALASVAESLAWPSAEVLVMVPVLVAGAAVGVVKLGDLEKIAGVRRAAKRDGAGTRQLDGVRGGIIAGGDGVVRGRGDVVKHLLERVAG